MFPFFILCKNTCYIHNNILFLFFLVFSCLFYRTCVIFILEHLVVECLPLIFIERRSLIYGKERFFNLYLTYYYHFTYKPTLHYIEVVNSINKNDTHSQK